MGLPLVLLAKLKLTAAAHGGVNPLVAGLVWPFIIKLSLSLRPLHLAYSNLLHSSRLFFFQMGQIAFNTHENAVNSGLGDSNRWERALRLVSERVAQVRRSQTSESEEESLRNLSMLAL